MDATPLTGAFLDELYDVIEGRKDADPDSSHTARLFAKGTNKIAQKVGEEAFETVIEGVSGESEALVSESADLLYHLLVLWSARGVRPETVWAALARRKGVSGLAEKAARTEDNRPPTSVGCGKERNSDMAAAGYDSENIFAKILRGEIPCDKVYEDDHVLAFRDINPQTPTHVLVIPKGAYVSLDDFSSNASEAELAGFLRAAGKIARDLGLVEPGYRVLANHGRDAHQEVPHFHLHMFAGKDLGRMIKPIDR